jgi:hypothetical protein
MGLLYSDTLYVLVREDVDFGGTLYTPHPLHFHSLLGPPRLTKKTIRLSAIPHLYDELSEDRSTRFSDLYLATAFR